jgi:predicted naringenin-chalcone synthase
MSWDVEDHGFVMRLSPRVPESVAAGLRPWVDEWLGRCGLSVGEVGSWAVHAGGPRIVAAVAERLELEESALGASRSVLAEHGNMSSATVLFVLKRIREAGGRLPCVVLAFGPGLFAEAALVVG